MERPRVLRAGSYTTGGPSLVSGWVRADAATSGALGRSPTMWAGWYDLRPWQETPQGQGQGDYRDNVTQVESGCARIRFTPAFGGPDDSGLAVNPVAIPSAGAYVNVQLGARSQLGPLTWQPEDDVNNTRTVQAVSLLVVGVDKPTLSGNWRTDIDPSWDQMDAACTPGNQRDMFQNWISVGPEVLSDLAHGPAATYDLQTLGGGCRFVGIWVVGYWVGPDVDRAQVGSILNWMVEDAPGPERHGPTTYAYPVRRVANVAAAQSDADPTRTVAQWSLQRFGSNDVYGNANGGPGSTNCSVVVANGGTQVDARVDLHVGTAVDKTASPSANMTAVAAATATACGMVRLPPAVTGNAADVQGPYSYGSLTMVTGSGVSPPNNTDTTAIVLVTVG